MVVMLALPQGALHTAPSRLSSHEPVARKEGARCLATPIWPDAGTATTVWNAEGLVQIQMANVGTDAARRGEPDLGVHVRAVHVNLAAVLVHELADLDDALLEHAMRARIRDHQRTDLLRVLSELRLQIIERDVALIIACHGHDLEAAHDRAGRVRAMRADRDEAHVALCVFARCVVATDRQQACILALRSRIRLQSTRRRSP